MNVIFEQVGICYAITVIVIRSMPGDPYPDGYDPSCNPDSSQCQVALFLNQFKLYWENDIKNELGFPVPRDLAHMMTGRGHPTGFFGIANGPPPNVCRSFFDPDRSGAYAVSWTMAVELGGLPGRTVLTAHEIAHNWGASHCCVPGGSCDPDCGLMKSQVLAASSSMGARTRLRIGNYLTTIVDCLDLCAD